MEKNDSSLSPLTFDFRPEAVIVGGGDAPSHPYPLALVHGCAHTVCCDGAANEWAKRGERPWRVVGDCDSLSAEAREAFREVIRAFPDQETNDQTKAVAYLARKGFRRMAIVGATGRREDHSLGNISLLMEYLHRGLEVRIYTDYGVFIPCRNRQVFRVPLHTAVSVFGFGTEGMTSTGLAYPLYDFDCWWQGTLNHSVEESFSIDCRGEYLVYLSYENRKERI